MDDTSCRKCGEPMPSPKIKPTGTFLDAIPFNITGYLCSKCGHWNDLKRRIETHNATTISELKDHTMMEWNNTDPDFLAKIADSMPDRCKAVVTSKGHKIPY